MLDESSNLYSAYSWCLQLQYTLYRCHVYTFTNNTFKAREVVVVIISYQKATQD